MNRKNVAPLATTLVRKIFSVYVVLALGLTLVQIGVAYRDGYSQVLNELNSTARQFEPGISNALWDYQESQIRSIAQGMMEGQIILGVDIRDVSSRINVTLVSKGLQVADLSISKRLELFHAVTPELRNRIGVMTLYSSHTVIIRRIQFGVMLIFISAIIKTVGLWLIIVFFANRLLAFPLRGFTEQIEKLDLENETHAPQIDIGAIAGVELMYLRDAFVDMTGKVVENKRALKQLASDLEKRVVERTVQLQTAQSELMTAARNAGMAQIAANVLHNVGNVLNSVNVSAGLIGKTIRGSKLEGLSNAIQMLRDHATDLGDFLTRDDRGKLLPGYLDKLTLALESERRRVLEELAQLIKSIDHIKEIVATQQSYAGVVSVVEMVQIRELLEDALRMNAEAFMRHRVSVLKEFEEVPPLPLDKHQLLLIIINLISNAKQAMGGITDRAHQITLRVKLIEGRLSIQVQDEGEGIPPENLTRIFGHGFSTRKEGHGFGLHSCALAARDMGGTLTAHSEGIGKGATFTLEIPIDARRKTR
jgi:signal transduction histidine kinase